MAQIANRMDGYGLSFLSKVYNQVGSPGSSVSSLNTYLSAGVKLDQNLAPRDGSWVFMADPQTQATATGLGLNLFNPQSNISEQYRKGQLAEALGFKWYMDQNVPRHANGTFSGTIEVDGAGQTGGTLVIKGLTGTLTAGTVFTIAGVNAVNPQTKANLGVPQQFVVLADRTGAGAMTISPAIVASGAFQNVSATAADSAGITVAGASGVSTQLSVAYHPDAFVMGVAELDTPGGTDRAFRATDPQTGVSVRIIRDYNVVTDQWITRFDVLFGFNTLYEQLACRIATS